MNGVLIQILLSALRTYGPEVLEAVLKWLDSRLNSPEGTDGVAGVPEGVPQEVVDQVNEALAA